MHFPIYLDYQATTPMDPEVLREMEPYFLQDFGNPASRSHSFGWKAQAAVEKARERVAALLGASASEIVFTSGATESNNLAIIGSTRGKTRKCHGKCVSLSAAEHSSVILAGKALEREGTSVDWIVPDPYARIDAARVEASLKSESSLVSAMYANNEVGTLNEVEAIGRLCKSRGVLFHCDAVQAASVFALDVNRMGADLVSLSAHKIYGPKGVGALYIRRRDPRVELEPLIHGGGQERGLRSGTLNVPGIVGFGKAAELCREHLKDEPPRLLTLTKLLREALEKVPGYMLNGHPTLRLPQNICFSLEGLTADDVMSAWKEAAVSTGSACASGNPSPSHVFMSCGLGAERAHGSIRLSIGRFTTEKEVNFMVNTLIPRLMDVAKRRQSVL